VRRLGGQFVTENGRGVRWAGRARQVCVYRIYVVYIERGSSFLRAVALVCGWSLPVSIESRVIIALFINFQYEQEAHANESFFDHNTYILPTHNICTTSVEGAARLGEPVRCVCVYVCVCVCVCMCV
jgi:hypothetical protein